MVDRLNAIERRLTNIESLERERSSRTFSSYLSDTGTSLDFTSDSLGLKRLNDTLPEWEKMYRKILESYSADEAES